MPQRFKSKPGDGGEARGTGTSSAREQVYELEAKALNGEALPPGWQDRLAPECLQASPVLLREAAESAIAGGDWLRARACLADAVKLFARQAHELAMLPAMARLAVVMKRVGPDPEAETLVRFLAGELERGEPDQPWNYEAHLALAAAGDLAGIPAAVRRGHWEAALLQLIGQDQPRRAWEELGGLDENGLGGAEAADVYGRLLAKVSDFARWNPAFAAHEAYLRLLQAAARGSRREADFALGQMRSLAGGDPALWPGLKGLAARLSAEHGDAAAAGQAAADVPASGELSGTDGWRVFLFGGLRFVLGGREAGELPLRRKKSLELLAYLLLRPHYTAPKEWVLEALFPEVAPEKADNHLYVTAHELKRALSSSLGWKSGITSRDNLIRLQDCFIEGVDVEQYLSLVRVADQLYASQPDLAAEMYERAFQLYAPLLPELPYAEWLQPVRDQLAARQAGLLRKLGEWAQREGEQERAEYYYREWLQMEPYQEDAARQLIGLLHKRGRPAEAGQVYRQFVRAYAEEFGTEPPPETKRAAQGPSEL